MVQWTVVKFVFLKVTLRTQNPIKDNNWWIWYWNLYNPHKSHAMQMSQVLIFDCQRLYLIVVLIFDRQHLYSIIPCSCQKVGHFSNQEWIGIVNGMILKSVNSLFVLFSGWRIYFHVLGLNARSRTRSDRRHTAADGWRSLNAFCVTKIGLGDWIL